MTNIVGNNIVMYSIAPQAFMNAILWNAPQLRWHVGGGSPRVNIVDIKTDEPWNYDHPYGWFNISVEDGDESCGNYHTASFSCDVNQALFSQLDDKGGVLSMFKYDRMSLWFKNVSEFMEVQSLLNMVIAELQLSMVSIYIDPDNNAVMITIELVTTNRTAAEAALEKFCANTDMDTITEEYDDYE